MKRIYIIIAAMLLVLGIHAGAAEIVDSGVYDSGFRYTLDSDGNLDIEGTGNMTDHYLDDRAPWYMYKTQVKKVTVAEGITSIGNSAFSDCEALKTIYLPSTVRAIGSGAFSRCGNLEEIIVSPNNPYYYSVGGVLFEKNTSTLVKYPSSKSDRSYVIPDGIKVIGDYAFWMCTKLNDITIPEGVTKIGNGAFWQCTTMREITIPSSVTSIGDAAFSRCSWLTTVNIPEGVESIGNKAFVNCTWIKEITIPDSVRILGNGAFFNCTALEKITLPKGITRIGDNLFLNCKRLTKVDIPENVTEIGNSAFYGCTSFTILGVPKTMKTIEENAFYNCLSFSVVNYAGTESDWKKINDSSELKTRAVKMNYKSSSSQEAEAKGITVTYNGEEVAFDQPPVAENGRTLVPFRAICETMGATVGWNGEDGTMTATLGDTTLVFTVGSTTVLVNGEAKTIDQPPAVINGRTLLPARAFAEELGATVGWDSTTQTVSITK